MNCPQSATLTMSGVMEASPSRPGLLGCLLFGSQRMVACNGRGYRKGIPSPWLRHSDLVCLAGFMRRL